MLMKRIRRILITGAGGAPSTNFIRSLKLSGERFLFIGVDCNKYYLARAETHERFLVPNVCDKEYLKVIKKIIANTKPDFLYCQPDQEILLLSKFRKALGVTTFWPSHTTIQRCQNKHISYEMWKRAGLTVPETMLIRRPRDLRLAFRKYGAPIWLRAIISPGGGKDSFKATNVKEAESWIRFCEGWGGFTAAQCLRKDSVTWMSIWKHGRLVVAQGRKRIYWEFGNRAPSGVTGITGTGITVSDPLVDTIAQKAILTIDHKPHGIFSVDLTYDLAGIPNPTEINIGRFFTTHLFFTEAGLNMPYIFLKAAFNERLPRIKKKINPLEPGLAWVRGMDMLPVLTRETQFEQYELALSQIRADLK